MSALAQALILSHFQALFLFAFFTSIVFACLNKITWRDRLREFAKTFLLFLLVGIGLSWLMFPFPR